MKKLGILITACAMLFAANGLAQKSGTPILLKEMLRLNEIQLKTGIVGSYPRHTEEFNWATDWVLHRTIETSYTTFGEPSAIEYTQGAAKNRDLFSYDGQHNLTERKSQNYSGSSWVDAERRTYKFNASGFETEMRHEQWTGTAWDLKDGTQTAYTMDGNRTSVIIMKEWNLSTQAWDNSARETYTYSGTGIYFTSIILDNWVGGAWAPNTKMEYSWVGNQVSETIVYEYKNGDWVRSSKMVQSSPDAYTEVMTMYMDDEAGGWMEVSRNTSKVDTHGNLILEQMEMSMGSWMVFAATRFTLTYDGNNLTQRITESFTFGTDWGKVLKEVFSNFASLSSDVPVLPANSISVFPNPAGSQAVVRLSLLNPGAVTLKLYSVTGQTVLEETVMMSGSDVNHQLNLSQVLPGSYFLVARDKQGNEIGTRLIKEK